MSFFGVSNYKAIISFNKPIKQPQLFLAVPLCLPT